MSCSEVLGCPYREGLQDICIAVVEDHIHNSQLNDDATDLCMKATIHVYCGTTTLTIGEIMLYSTLVSWI